MGNTLWDFQPAKDFPACTAFNYIGFVCFLISTIKSIVDLIVSEIYYRDTPLAGMSFCKLFHILLPFSQGFYCFCTLAFNVYCVDIRDQQLWPVFLCSLGGYVLVFCFLLNAYHWIFLTFETNSLKIKGFIFGFTFVFFVVAPFTFEILFIAYHKSSSTNNFRQNVHFTELIYASTLNIMLTGIVFWCWRKLHKKLETYAGLNTISRLRTRLKRQMVLYIVFFLIRAVFLLIGGIMGFVDQGERDSSVYGSNRKVRLVFYFISNIFGDIPLALVMLYFLQHRKKPEREKATGTSPVDNRQQQPTQPGYPIADRNETQPTDYLFTSETPQYYGAMQGQSAPYYYSSQLSGLDPNASTNSYYTPQEGGYI